MCVIQPKIRTKDKLVNLFPISSFSHGYDSITCCSAWKVRVSKPHQLICLKIDFLAWKSTSFVLHHLQSTSNNLCNRMSFSFLERKSQFFSVLKWLTCYLHLPHFFSSDVVHNFFKSFPKSTMQNLLFFKHCFNRCSKIDSDKDKTNNLSVTC